MRIGQTLGRGFAAAHGALRGALYLFLLHAPIQGPGRAFAHGDDGNDYVLGTDLNLWQEQPGWQINGRTWVDGNVRSFSLGDDGYDYVLGTDGNLWQELPGWQTQGRTWVDGNVRGSEFGSDVYCLALGPRPAAAVAYSPTNGTLFGPGGPSYLDVQQGFVGDCWLIASLSEVAARAPSDITSMFTYDGTTVVGGATSSAAVDIYTVRLYDNTGVAQYFTVDTELPGGRHLLRPPCRRSGRSERLTQPRPVGGPRGKGLRRGQRIRRRHYWSRGARLVRGSEQRLARVGLGSDHREIDDGSLRHQPDRRGQSVERR
jgi:hypothetical protein